MMHLMKVVGTFKLLLVGYVLGIVNDVLAVLSPSLKRKLAIFLERSNSYGKGWSHLYHDRVYGTSFFKNILEFRWNNISEQVRLGGRAVDTTLFNLNSKNASKLFSLVSPGQILIMNFGSATSPIFVEKFPEYKRLVSKYSKDKRVTFIVIYQQEAHPCDGYYPMEHEFQINKHRTLQERLNAGMKFNEKMLSLCPLYSDPICDETSQAYGAMPERLCAIKDWQVIFLSEPGSDGYSVSDLQNWLSSQLPEISKQR